MKTQINLNRALRLANELTAELQRLEHEIESALPDSACEATDELEQVRSARDSAIEAKERLVEISP